MPIDPYQSERYLPATGTQDFVQALEAWLLPGWETSLQMEDPLTQTLDEVSTSLADQRAKDLALARLPEAFTEAPSQWSIERLGFQQCHIFPLVSGERPFGRLLLFAQAESRPLGRHRKQQIQQLCSEAAADLERARAHHEDEKFSERLRKITETELAIRFSGAALRLCEWIRATVIFGYRGNELKILEARHGSRRQERFLYRKLPFEASHLAQLSATSQTDARAVMDATTFRQYAEGEALAPLIRILEDSPRVKTQVETLPLESAGRLLGSAVLFYGRTPSAIERRATQQLAEALAFSLDRIRPERRRASGLLYLQGLLRSSRGGALVGVLSTVVEEIVTFLGADAGILALVDTDTGNLLLSEHAGYGHDAKLPKSIPFHQQKSTSILAHVFRTGEPYVAPDIRASSIYLAADPSIRSEIAVPLRLHGETVGVAMASSRRPDTFRSDDSARFQLLADQIAVAIDDARLLDSLRAQRQEEAVQRQHRRFGFHPSVHADDVEYHFGNLVGEPSGPMGQVYRTIERVADREQDIVLILGETGSGKEMISHAIHNASPRRSRSLVATNFAALGGDPNLIQSELFGHEKGSFTGAVRRRRGCFEKAHESSLLIDELGDMTPSVQVKLLRVLGRTSKREFQRLGGEENLSCDVRVLAATNKDLQAEMAAGRFREDLYYRLSALVVRIPPLQERPGDIPLLVRHFIPRLNNRQPLRIAKGVDEELAAYSFPGNIRQLESVLLRAIVMFGNPDELTREDIQNALRLEEDPGPSRSEPNLQPLFCPDPAPPDWFWHAVYEPWKEHRLSRQSVESLLRQHLASHQGFYSRVANRLGVAKKDYQRFIDFLKHSGLKVDHRPFR